MDPINKELTGLLKLLEIERKEEREQYRERFLNTPLAERKAQGLSWYPVSISNEEIGLGDRLVVEIERSATTGQAGIFQNGSIASLWVNLESKKAPPFVTGVVIKTHTDRLWMALEVDELPEWVEDGKLGLDLYYDERTYDVMEKAVKEVMDAKGNRLAVLRDVLLGKDKAGLQRQKQSITLPDLNESQNEALNLVVRCEEVAAIHGPPGTGKTTTLVRAIAHTCKTEKQVLVCAASNLAVDLLTEKLAEAGLFVLRLGHPARVSEDVLKHSLDVQVALHPAYQEMKNYRKDAEKIRGKALKFKRQFGKEERAQRKELLSEAKYCQQQARQLEQFIFKDLVDKATVITCTLTGSASSMLKGRHFSTLFMDEAAQAMEPAAWIPIRMADRIVFAGDHCQLPPTVKSRDAEAGGLGKSLFEKVVERQDTEVMLQTQYRMHGEIMEFSNRMFYDGKLKAAEEVVDHRLSEDPEKPLLHRPFEFVDIAGTGFEEVHNEKTRSRSNPGEGDLLLKHLGNLLKLLPKPDPDLYFQDAPEIGVISPYKDQVKYLREAAKDHQPLWPWLKRITIDTVDGFQGQERDIICISLVRSNAKGEIGFLRDIRRMNVAMTRAKKKLIVAGDSATLGNHKFYQQFLDYVEEVGAYVSAWELME
jgi:energy-coupling factor transporter ATP-binding protein EcfA2